MKKIVSIIVLFLIAAGIIAASFFVPQLSITPSDMAEIKSNCASCHSVPKIQNREQIHDFHEFLKCSDCHTGGTNNGEDGNEEAVNNNVCVSCHTKTDYTSAVAMHDAHSTTACTACHTESAGSAAADNTHTILRWAGICLMVAVAFGLLLNYIIARVRLTHKVK